MIFFPSKEQITQPPLTVRRLKRKLFRLFLSASLKPNKRLKLWGWRTASWFKWNEKMWTDLSITCEKDNHSHPLHHLLLVQNKSESKTLQGLTAWTLFERCLCWAVCLNVGETWQWRSLSQQENPSLTEQTASLLPHSSDSPCYCADWGPHAE